jgi:hypothetical protein
MYAGNADISKKKYLTGYNKNNSEKKRDFSYKFKVLFCGSTGKTDKLNYYFN